MSQPGRPLPIQPIPLDPLPITGAGELGEIRWTEIGREVVAAAFPASATSIPLARSWVCLAMAMYGRVEDTNVAALLVGELVTNVLRHADTDDFTVRLDFTTGFELAVHDHDATPPERRQPTAWDTAGRGLALVAGLAESWGTRAADDGKWVWFRLGPPLPHQNRRWTADAAPAALNLPN